MFACKKNASTWFFPPYVLFITAHQLASKLAYSNNKIHLLFVRPNQFQNQFERQRSSNQCCKTHHQSVLSTAESTHTLLHSIYRLNGASLFVWLNLLIICWPPIREPKMDTPRRKLRNLHMENVQNSSTPIRVPPSPMLKTLGHGTGVSVYRLDRSPRLGQIRSPWAVKRITQSMRVRKDTLFNARIVHEADILRWVCEFPPYFLIRCQCVSVLRTRVWVWVCWSGCCMCVC